MPTDSRTDWNDLAHSERIEVLATRSMDQIVQDYRLGEELDSEFREHLAREIRLWQPDNVGELKTAGKPPTKDVVLGAWRDLDRSEALLELIDNSIDEWLRRRTKVPDKTAPELNIYIDIDEESNQLTYEDNAGGVSVDKLEHLVVPGFSDTTALSPTIGSYKTGGKKAVFRLAEAAAIVTRYWNPAGTTDDAIAVQLGPEWINDPDRYDFPYALLKDKSVIEKGQTRYVFQLREEPVGGAPWYTEPDQVQKIVDQIQLTYTLLLIRNPAIKIYFLDRSQPLKPLDDLYDFSATHAGEIDIRPQQVTFEAVLELEGRKHDVQIEVVLGCRRTSGSKKGGPSWGIDLYGNDRLFVAYDQTTFADRFPASAAKNLIRGYINIKGPNVFIPWDTHKRHLNTDRDIMRLLTTHKLVRNLFDNWRATYAAIAASGEVSNLIQTPLANIIDRSKRDLAIPHRATVAIGPKRGRGAALPDTVYRPKVTPKKKQRDTIQVTFTLTTDQARTLAAQFGIVGDFQQRATANELSSSIKNWVLRKSKR
ncbi:MAG TPA: hypothetical protein VF092_15765 [Longimicrobium sp.]